MLKHLQNLKNTKGEIFDQRDITYIVEHAFKIAVNYLKLSYVRVQKLINAYEMTYEDIAIDSIAPLFIKNKNDIHYMLVSAYISWQPPVKNDDDALFFLNKIVAARVEQHLTLMLREVDPVFGKILDSVNYFVDKSGYKKSNYLGYLYIVEKNCKAIHGKVIDPFDFEFLPLHLFYNKQTALLDILNYIKFHSDYFPAVPMNAFVSRLKRLSFLDAIGEPSVNFYFNRIEIDESINHGLTIAKSKLKKSYRETKKLSRLECNAIEKVLNEIAFDLRNGGIHGGMYDYFVNHLPKLSKEEFKIRFQNIIDYLYKLMKGSIAAKLKN